MTKRLLIHIGYHKTVTTWMQQLLFLPSVYLRYCWRGRRPAIDYVDKTVTGHFTQSNARLKAMIGDTADLSAYR